MQDINAGTSLFELRALSLNGDQSALAEIQNRYQALINECAAELSKTRVAAKGYTNFGLHPDEFIAAAEEKLPGLIKSWTDHNLKTWCSQFPGDKRNDLYLKWQDYFISDHIETGLKKAMNKLIHARQKIVGSLLKEAFDTSATSNHTTPDSLKTKLLSCLKESYEKLTDKQKNVLTSLHFQNASMTKTELGKSLAEPGANPISPGHIGRIEYDAFHKMCSRGDIPKLLDEYFSTPGF